MSNLRDHLNKDEEQIAESKGIGNIISSFFRDMSGFLSFSSNAKKATNKYQKQMKAAADTEGNISVEVVERLMDEYINTLETLAKNSKASKSLTDTFMEGIYKEVEEFKKSLS